jgi:23S rRNA U2552 (ribose-2'-O)-methylase RlmE/FtsJ
MSYFYLPKVYINLSKNMINKENVKIILNNNNPNIASDIYLKSIDNLKNFYHNEWDENKKHVHNYNYVVNVKDKEHLYVTKHRALSKTFYIILEINKLIDFISDFSTYDKITTFHMSKCQTGVIEALLFIRSNKKDKHVGIFSDEWRNEEAFLMENKNIQFDDYLSYNLFNTEYLSYCMNQYQNNFDIITFINNNEKNKITMYEKLDSIDIIILKICYAIIMQKKNGHMIFKVPETNKYIYYELIYLLSSMYEKIIIVKPNISKNLKPEKYIICKKFRNNYNNNILYTFANNIISILKEKNESTQLFHLLNVKIPVHFLNKIEECNTIITQQLIDTNINIINLCINNNPEKIELIKRKNINKSIYWCLQHNLEYNKYLENKDY